MCLQFEVTFDGYCNRKTVLLDAFNGYKILLNGYDVFCPKRKTNAQLFFFFFFLTDSRF